VTEACIVGWAHSPFGKLEDRDIESLIERVVRPAIEDAGVPAGDIDAVFVGQFNSGFSKQNFPASLAMQSVPELRFKPATRCENACASGSAAIHAARNFLAAKRGRFALVVGVEKMTNASGAEVGDNLLGASYRREEGEIPMGFAGIFGRIAENYFRRPGPHRRQEPQERLRQPVCPCPQGSRLRFLPQGEREEPLRRRTAEADGLLAGVRRRRRADHDH
jgi:acetyl-CoA C-acetyltransferase